MDFEDELPCGGYEEEDSKIQQNLQSLSLEADGQPPKEAPDCSCHNKGHKDNNQPKPQNTNDPKKKVPCKKCKQSQAVLVHKNEPICKECLLKNIEYKTRLTLENRIYIRQHSRILLCFSGGLNSICMANIMNNLQKRYQKHPLFAAIECLHVQQQGQLPDHYEQKFEAALGLKLHIIPIHGIFRDQTKDYQSAVNLFRSLPHNCNSVDLLTLFRRNLVVEFADKHGFDCVMEAKNGESLAAEVFKYFSKGIGGNTEELCSSGSGQIHYPLMQHLQKELQYYFYCCKLGKVSMLAAEDDLSNLVSTELDSFLDRFITTLQDRYSHTAPAIVRTAEKLNSNFKQGIKKCKWCGLSHDLAGFLCQKCVRLHAIVMKDPATRQQIPAWMKQEIE